MSVTAPVGELRLGAPPSQMWPNSLQRKFEGGPSWLARFRLAVVSNSGTPAAAEQSSSFVIRMIARYASLRRKPTFSAGGPAPSAPSARVIAANWCSKPHPLSPSAAMQVNTSSRLPV